MNVGAQKEETVEMKELQLSTFGFWGLTSNKSFKGWGKISEESIVVLVDSRATVNFISAKAKEAPGILDCDQQFLWFVVGRNAHR